jgi:hypothetical protein
MPDARLLELHIPVDDQTTHFRLRFSTDVRTWTPFSPADPSPAVPADIVVDALDADGNYVLDGINNPQGNMALASQDGTVYQYQLKTLGGYGSWSYPSIVTVVVEGDGPLADVAALRERLGQLDLMFGLDGYRAETDRLLAQCLAEAMDEARSYSSAIDALYARGQARTGRETRMLRDIEVLLAGSAAMRRVEVMRAGGTHEPLLMEQSEQIAAVRESLREEAYRKLQLLAGGPRMKPFALPAFAAVGVTPREDWRPSDRNRLLDERDDRGSWQEVE